MLRHVLDLYQISFPPEVAAELKEEYPSGREFWRNVRSGTLNEQAPTVRAVHAFGSGERAAINLALEFPDWLLLIDDRRPLQAAQQLGVRTACTPVLVVHLVQIERMDLNDAMTTLARLAAMKTVSPVLIDGALTSLGTFFRDKDF